MAMIGMTSDRRASVVDPDHPSVGKVLARPLDHQACQRREPFGRARLPGQHVQPPGEALLDPCDLRALAVQTPDEQRIVRAASQQTSIDDPCVGLDVRTTQVFLKRSCLMHRRGLWQGDEQDSREGRITKPLKQSQYFLRLRAACLPFKFTLISLTGIQK